MDRNLTRQKDLEYYLGLTYPVQLTHQVDDEDEYWLAEILDLPGCMSDGTDPNEALENIEDAKRLWIETQLEDGYEVPEPMANRSFSGKFLVRMPKSLHYRLASQAKREGLSLNQFVVSLLSNRDDHSRQLQNIEEAMENLKSEFTRLSYWITRRTQTVSVGTELPIMQKAGFGEYRLGIDVDDQQYARRLPGVQLTELAGAHYLDTPEGVAFLMGTGVGQHYTAGNVVVDPAGYITLEEVEAEWPQ